MRNRFNDSPELGMKPIEETPVFRKNQRCYVFCYTGIIGYIVSGTKLPF